MSPDDNDEKFRRVADSWIIVTTVFLALQLSMINFTMNFFIEKNQPIELYLVINAIGVTAMGLALSTFLGVKDPRLKRYSLPSIIDKGVKVVFVSVIMSSITLGVGTYIITDLLLASILVSFLIISMSAVMYSMYRKTIHGKKLD